MATPQSLKPGTRFLRLPDVMATTGLSKSEVYRRIECEENPLPKPYRYKNGGPRAGVFWRSDELEDWQMREISE